MSMFTPHESSTNRFPRVFHRFVSNENAIYATISVVASLISVFVSVVLVRWPDKVPWIIIVRDIAIVFLITFAAFFWFYKFVKSDESLRTTEQRLKDSLLKIGQMEKTHLAQISHFHRTVHEFRTIVFRDFAEPHDLDVRISSRELEAFKDICESVTRQLREQIMLYLNDQGLNSEEGICISVKLIVPSVYVVDFLASKLSKDQLDKISAKDQWVVTVYRDPVTWATQKSQREVSKALYDIDKNTAFTTLIRMQQTRFISDNLRELAASGGYHNENPRWSEQYNATIAVPIRYLDEETGTNIVYGVLAADSLNTENRQLFEKSDGIFDVMAHSADLLSNFFLTAALYQYYELYQTGD